jgi:FKBP-type peptidyl-prolyl cis-trans isomerase
MFTRTLAHRRLWAGFSKWDHDKETRMRIKPIVICTLLVVLSVSPTWGAQKASTALNKLNTEEEKTSYALGLTIGRQIAGMLKNNQTSVMAKFFVIGIQDVLESNKLAMSDEEMKSVMENLNQQAAAKREQQMSAMANENRAAGQAYLDANANKEGVKTTKSGLQYKVLQAGTGSKPQATDTVKVHYRGTLIDGTEFDSSFKRGQPAQFPLNRVIPGWTEGLQLMNPGSKYQFVIPSDIAYGDQGSPPTIPPAATLIFEVELLEVTPAADQAVEVKPNQ